MSDPEGTPKKVPRKETSGGEEDGSDRRSPPCTPPRHSVSRSASSGPVEPADNTGAPSTPSKLFHSSSASSTPSKDAHRNAPSTLSKHQAYENLADASEFQLTPALMEKITHQPTTLSIIVEDVDMEDADKPSQLSDAPKSSLAKWLQELGAGLNSLSHTLFGCVKQPETKEYEWVHSFRYKPLCEEERWLSEVYKDIPPHRTHLNGLAIPEVFCFEVSARKLKELSTEVIKKLGARVNFPKERLQTCPQPNCSPCHLFYCNACPHQYSCDCEAKEEYNGGQWCPHIHVAYTMNMNVYGSDVCLFIQEDYTNLTEKRHIRAMIQGPTKMYKVESNLYIENFDYLVRSVRYHVKVNASEIPKNKCKCGVTKKCFHCDACWCRYSCTCEDYWCERQVCEHIHNVAMQEQRERVSLHAQFSFSNFKESKEVYLQRPSDWLIVGERRMMNEHELSYYIPFKYIHEIEKDQMWKMASSRDRRVATVVASRPWLDSCICKKPDTTKALMCVICKICPFDYTCDCMPPDDILVCRHMHAVARFRKSDSEPTGENMYLKEKLEFYREYMTELEKKLRYLEIKTTRKHESVRSLSETSGSTSSYTTASST